MNSNTRQYAPLQAESNRFAAIVRASTDAIVSLDLDGAVTSWNQGAERLFGFAADAVIGRMIDAIMPQLDRAALSYHRDQLLQGESTVLPDSTWITPDGRQVAFSVTLSPIYDSAGAVVGVAAIGRDITDRKQLEDALRASEEKFSKAFRFNPAAVVLSTRDTGLFLDVNETFLRMFGYTRAELIGRTSIELGIFDPRDRAVLHAAYTTGGTLQNQDVRLVAKSGAVIDVILSVEPIDVNGVPCILSTAVDNRERKQMQELLRDRERKYRELYDNSPDMYFAGQPQQRLIVDCNLTLARTLGYTKAELVGNRSTILFAPASEARLEEGLREFLETRQRKNLEVQLRHKDGTIIDALLSAVLESDPTGGPDLSRVTLRDVTERKRIEEALKASEAKFSIAFRASPNAITIARLRDGIILDANQAFLAMTGYAPDELIGKSNLQLGIVEPSAGAELAARILNDGYVRDFEGSIYTKDRQARAVLMSLEQIEIAGEPCMLATTVDITDRKRMELALRDLNLELDQRVAEQTVELRNAVAELQRANTGKDAFMAAVSHELRTPLAGVLAMAETLDSELRGKLNDDQKRYVAAIRTSGTRLLSMINNVLSYTVAMSLHEPFAPEDCRLEELGAISVRKAQIKAAAKQQTIALAVTPLDLEIRSDGNSILEILHALLDNAVKFSPPATTVNVTICAVGAGNAVQLIVADQGIGISPEQQAYLFEPFTQIDQRLAREFEGIGLGLALVKRKVDLLGGTVVVDSTPGAGSRFIVTLPSNASVAI